MKKLTRPFKIVFVVVSLLCIACVLWPPRAHAVNVGATCFVWAGLGHMAFERWQVRLVDGGVEKRVQVGPVLTIRYSPHLN